MSQIETVRNELDYIQNHVLNTLKTSLTLIPDDKINFKPQDDLNDLKFLMYHVVNCPFIYLSGLGKDTFNDKDFKSIAFETDQIKKFSDLVDYYNKFYSFIDTLKSSLKVNQLGKSISYDLDKVGWGSWELTGQRAIETAFEEMIHHRGQIYIYLRMLGIKPPLIYPYL